MTHPLTLAQAKAHVEKVLLRREHIAGQRCDTVEIITWDLDEFPEAGFRIAEVSWSLTGDPAQGDTFKSAGASVMQSDMPLGLASCAAVERWIVGLILGDAEIIREARADYDSLGRDDGVRNLARFTTSDAEAVLGRPLTESEYRRLVKTLENSSMGEVFAECLDLCIEEES